LSLFYCELYYMLCTVDGQAHYGVYQSPCSDHCQELRQQEEKLKAMRLRGLALRREYLKAGFENGNSEEVCLLKFRQVTSFAVYNFHFMSANI